MSDTTQYSTFPGIFIYKLHLWNAHLHFYIIRCVCILGKVPTGFVILVHSSTQKYQLSSHWILSLVSVKNIHTWLISDKHIGHFILIPSGLGSSVSIATELRAGRSGIESRWGRDFPPVQTGPGAHPASCKMGTGSFPGVKCGRGVLQPIHPLLVLWLWKSRVIPLPTLWATPGL